MVSRQFSRVFVGVLFLAVALLSACEKKNSNNPTGPPADPNGAMYGTWLGILTGPDTVQHSRWEEGSRDSIRIVFRGATMKFYMSPVDTSSPALSTNSDSCFVRHPAALNLLSDPNVSFRLNFLPELHLGGDVLAIGARNGNTLTGSLLIAGDTLAGSWTALFCAACTDSDSVKVCP